MTEAEAALYELPFQHVLKHVKPVRDTNRRAARARNWWRYGEPRPGLRRKLATVSRYVATSEKSKHCFFVWLPISVAPDNRLIAFPREDDAFFGVLSSRIHVTWALAVGSTLEDRPAYATTTCFEKFPFPAGLTPDLVPTAYTNSRAGEIGAAAKTLNRQRENWLNPPAWTDRVPEVTAGYPDRIVAKSGHEADLKQRTLTSLYNARPAWLDNAHKALDAAVAKAYGWTDYTPEMIDQEILRRLLALNRDRSIAGQPVPVAPSATITDEVGA
jgi:type II restriction/modification system DNA methylase subunit YeeA